MQRGYSTTSTQMQPAFVGLVWPAPVHLLAMSMGGVAARLHVGSLPGPLHLSSRHTILC